MKVLMIAPACDGEDVGEAWVAVQWAKLAVRAPRVDLLTTYKRGHTPTARGALECPLIEWESRQGWAGSSG